MRLARVRPSCLRRVSLSSERSSIIHPLRSLLTTVSGLQRFTTVLSCALSSSLTDADGYPSAVPCRWSTISVMCVVGQCNALPKRTTVTIWTDSRLQHSNGTRKIEAIMLENYRFRLSRLRTRCRNLLPWPAVIRPPSVIGGYGLIMHGDNCTHHVHTALIDNDLQTTRYLMIEIITPSKQRDN